MNAKDTDLDHLAEKIFNTPDEPGNDTTRLTYYNHETTEGQAGLELRWSVRMPDPRKAQGRLLIQVPEKLRDNLRTLYGVDDDEDYKLGTSIVALADWACGELIEQKKRLKVSQAK